jgi:hypothetical protein
MSLTRTQVWSCGGGTQSAAIAALIVQGKLSKPDLAVIVDTEREKSSTWHFVNNTLIPQLRRMGVDLAVVRKSKYATVDLYGTTGSLLIPAFSTQATGDGKMDNFCSTEWKKRVLQRWLREQGVQRCDVWMGISTDELKRVRQSGEGWFQYRYPLVFDVPMSRHNCRSLVQSLGWPDPPRSACWMCPNMTDREWIDLRDNWPEDLAKATQLEGAARMVDEHIYLHVSKLPLAQIAQGLGGSEQMEMFGNCDSGFCFV